MWVPVVLETWALSVSWCGVRDVGTEYGVTVRFCGVRCVGTEYGFMCARECAGHRQRSGSVHKYTLKWSELECCLNVTFCRT